MVIAYIKSKQGGVSQLDSTKAPAANKDSAAVKKP
jgi:hypothetical protein